MNVHSLSNRPAVKLSKQEPSLCRQLCKRQRLHVVLARLIVPPQFRAEPGTNRVEKVVALERFLVLYRLECLQTRRGAANFSNRNRAVERDDRRSTGFAEQIVERKDPGPVCFVVTPGQAMARCDTGLEMERRCIVAGRRAFEMRHSF